MLAAMHSFDSPFLVIGAVLSIASLTAFVMGLRRARNG